MSSFKELAKDIKDSVNPWISTDEVIPACYKTLNLIEIPGIMQKTGRLVGAALMNKWFSKTSYTMPEDVKALRIPFKNIPAQAIETNIISMKWVLNFTRTHGAYNELKDIISRRNIVSLGKSKERLFDLLRQHNKLLKVETSFGGSHLNTSQIFQTASLNFRSIGTKLSDQMMDPTDDLYCALGAFTMHLTASGKVKPVNNGPTTHEIHIDKFGFFIKDTYDFNGIQPLGFWNQEGVSKGPASGYWYIDNSSFSDWRKKHNKGGDFFVFSDILWQPLRSPVIWKYPY